MADDAAAVLLEQQEADEDEEVDIGEDDWNMYNKNDVATTSDHSKESSQNRCNSKQATNGDNSVTVDSSDEDQDSALSVAEHLRVGCECTQRCFEGLDPEHVYKHRLNIAELTKIEHDMYLMGVTMASIANSKTTSRNKERKRQRASYVYQGKRVCLEAFLFLENVTLYHIKRIRNHVLVHGITPRNHGNLGKKPHNAFSLDIYRNVEKYVKKFLTTYIKDFSKNQIIYGLTRSDIYNSYKDHGRKSSEKLMGYSTFRHFLKEQFPTIRFSKVDHTKLDSGPKKKMRVVEAFEQGEIYVTKDDVDVEHPGIYILTPLEEVEGSVLQIIDS